MRSDARGFTMVEVLVVVAIIGISAAVAVPAVQSGRRQREIRQTLQHFVAAIRAASSKAVLQRRTVELWVRTEDNAYELAVARTDAEGADAEASATRDAGEGREPDEFERAEGKQAVGHETLPASARFGEVHGGRALSQNVVAFPFFPTGGSSGGEVELVFESGGTRTSYRIGFDPLVSAIELKQEGS
jgi:type II secretion system protein H